MNEGEFENLIIKDEPIDVIKELTNNEKLPLILWGAGQVASEVKNYLEKNNIFLDAVWVDWKNEKTTFGELPILSFKEIKEKYNKFNIILGHSKYDLGSDLLEEKQVNKVFYLVSVAYGQYNNFDYENVKRHIKDYYNTYQLLDDEQSRKAMIAYLNTRINNNICYIKECMTHEQSYFKNDIYRVNEEENYLDVGAFDGDSIKLFLKECGAKYNRIYALEPDKINYKKLESYVKEKRIKDVFLYNIGTWKEKNNLYFQEEGQESGVSSLESNTEISVDSLDNILNGKPVSLIKINFRSGLLETLVGAKKILQNYRPKLAIVVGFDEWLIIHIPQYIKKVVPEYKLYLRYNRCMPACLTLYAAVDNGY